MTCMSTTPTQRFGRILRILSVLRHRQEPGWVLLPQAASSSCRTATREMVGSTMKNPVSLNSSLLTVSTMKNPVSLNSSLLTVWLQAAPRTSFLSTSPLASGLQWPWRRARSPRPGCPRQPSSQDRSNNYLLTHADLEGASDAGTVLLLRTCSFTSMQGARTWTAL